MSLVSGRDAVWEHYEATSGPALAVGVQYAYDLLAEFGAGFDFVEAPSAKAQLLLPWVGVRPHVALSSHLELGLTLLGGPSWMLMSDVADAPSNVPNVTSRDHSWFGYNLGCLVDLRVWTAPNVAIDFGPGLRLGSGHDPTFGHWPASDGTDPRPNAGFVSLGLVLRLVYVP